MSDDLAAALERTRQALSRFDRMVDWRVDSHPSAVSLRKDGSLDELSRGLRSVADLVTWSSLEAHFPGASLAFQMDSGGQVTLASSSPGDLADSFGADHIDDARDAWNGDFAAASRLPGAWTVSATISPARLLQVAVPDIDWYVFEDTRALMAFLGSAPFWRSQELLNPERATALLVREAAPEEHLKVTSLGVFSLQARDIALPAPPQKHAGSAAAHPLLDHALKCDALLPESSDGSAFPDVALALARLGAGVAWAEIATAITLGADNTLRLEFFGLQRVAHNLPAAGPNLDLEACRSSIELANWALKAEGTDRLIATRQVASLRLDVPPWERPGDVRKAAEPIFVALRSAAVAETLKAQREAKSAALSAAQRTAELTTSLTKGAIERCLASLLAVGGVIVARSTSSLTDDQASRLRLLVAVILLLLALWNVCFERPAMFRIAADHRADLGEFNELMSVDEKSRILSLRALASARSQAIKVAIAIPGLYLMAAAAAVLVR